MRPVCRIPMRTMTTWSLGLLGPRGRVWDNDDNDDDDDNADDDDCHNYDNDVEDNVDDDDNDDCDCGDLSM